MLKLRHILLAALNYLLNAVAWAIVYLESRETVKFSVLCKHRNHVDICKLLGDLDIDASSSKHSDYIRCETSTRIFISYFCKLRWRSLVVGSWELVGDGRIPDVLQDDIKMVLLHKNLMLPPKFITNSTIK